MIKRGTNGYWPAMGMTLEEADRRNSILNITSEQKMVMEIGSMFRWYDE